MSANSTVPGVAGVTILVCTYNGAARLPETLRHLAQQQVPAGQPWEVLLVSNASTDETLRLAPRLWAELGAPAPLRVLNEPKPGKENALVQGFDEAAGEYVCIVDDDNWLYPDYIARVCATMGAHPEIGVLGAFAEGAFEVAPPAWFAQFQAVYAVGPAAAQSGPLHQLDAYIAGAGSVVRRSGWQRLRANGFKFTTSVQRGAVLSGGEDVELCHALRLAGYTLWYDERLRFRHFMYKNRLTWDYLFRMGRGTAGGLTNTVYFLLMREPGLDTATFSRRYYRWMAWTVWQLLRQPGRLLSYWLQRHDETHPETFNTMRRLYGARAALTGHAEAVRIFNLVKPLQQRLRASAAGTLGSQLSSPRV